MTESPDDHVSLEAHLLLCNADLVMQASRLCDCIDRMIGEGEWHGDDIAQLQLDAYRSLIQARKLDEVEGSFLNRFRHHRAAHNLHMKLGERFEKMLDRDITGGRIVRR